MASHRLALARERGLREASAALVSAADADEVAEAVRKAVAQLLPADTPHRVVLAMAYSEPDQPSLAAKPPRRPPQDRAAGTSARLVATRDVDWAVAVRLTQFAMVLRCPLVLADRPTGDPLVGVLHVGAPALGAARPAARAGGARHPGRPRAGTDRAQRGGHPAQQRGVLPYPRAEHLRRHPHRRRRGPGPVREPVRRTRARRRPGRACCCPSSSTRATGRGWPSVLAEVRRGDDRPEGIDFRAVGRRRTEVMLEMHCRDLRDRPDRRRAWW